MKKNKIFTAILIVALLAVLSIGTAFAASAETTTNNPVGTARRERGRMGRAQLTDEQKAEIEAKKATKKAAQEKWDALAQEKKDEIYALKEKSLSAQTQIIDKYLELGIIDEETANQMKQELSDKIANIKENSVAPMLGRRGGNGKGNGIGRRGCVNPPVTE